MKVTLISPYPDITAFGIRTISSYIKESGHRTQLLFLPDPWGDRFAHGVKRYKDHVLSNMVPLCEDSDLIGVTLMTNFFEGAVQITQAIKARLGIPIVWGGVHPSIKPEEGLRYADMVCVGDGEDSILELLLKMERGEPYWNTPGFWFKRDGAVIKNKEGGRAQNLDRYPRPDYSLQEHYILYKDSLCKLTPELLQILYERSVMSNFYGYVIYQTLAGRGCPHKCTYCANDFFKGMYNGPGFLRWRSIPHVIDELLWVRETLPYIGAILFNDDSFFARGVKNIGEFARVYKEKIGLPFLCLGSPLTMSDEKLDLLVNAGLRHVQMGVQTGSRKMLEIFNRKSMTNEKTLSAMHKLNRYKNKLLPPHYDFILDSPYETPEDKIETLRLISHIPKPFKLTIYSMVLFPGTQLYEMAKRDGLIRDEFEDIYNRSYTQHKEGYINLLFILVKGGHFPGWLLRIFLSQPMAKILNSHTMEPIFKYSMKLLRGIYHHVKMLTCNLKQSNAVRHSLHLYPR